MKATEIIKKINAYNEVAEMVGADKLVLKVCIGFSSSKEVENMKSLKKYIRSEYIDCVADAILNYNGYEINNRTKISAVDSWGKTFTELVEFYVASKW